MRRSRDRILTTHAGSLPRPDDLIALMQAKETGQPYDAEAFAGRARSAVSECVRQQVAAGIDVVSDGELAKPGFFKYVMGRLDGMATNADAPPFQPPPTPDFPGYQEWRRSQRVMQPGGFGFGFLPGRMECVGPLAWKDRAALQADIDNLKAAVAASGAREAFMPSASPSIVTQRIHNAYYPSQQAYLEAVAELMREEYVAITGAGFVLQIDAPEYAIDRMRPEFRGRPIGDYLKTMESWVEALNHALRGIPEEQVRFHVCWGNGEAPHTQDTPLRDIVSVVLKVHAGAYSVEGANPRHGHEWALWKEVRLPEGKLLIPGVIDSVTNFVEHPELVAERIVRYAEAVGTENLIAGTDCGFGTSAMSTTVYPPVVYAKLAALAEGASLASRQLWGLRTENNKEHRT